MKKSIIILFDKIVYYGMEDFHGEINNNNIYVSTTHGHGKPDNEDLKRFDINVAHIESGLYSVQTYGEFETIEEAIIYAIKEAMLEPPECHQITSIEVLAETQNIIWSHWTDHQFSKCIENEDGSLTIPKELVIRWKRQANTNYNELSEKEKQSDRDIVNQFILK